MRPGRARIDAPAHRSTARPLVALALALAAISAPAPARAQAGASDEDARLHFELGRRAHDRADYEVAAREFESAIALADRPELHYNLFLVYHELGRNAEAAEQLRLYLPHEADPSARAHLEARLRRLETAIATPEAPAETAAEASEPPETTMAIDDATPADPTPTSVATGPEDGLVIASSVLLAAGGATLVAFGVVGGLALSERQSLDSRCQSGCTAADVQTGRDLALGADVSLGVGLGLAALGGALLVTSLTGAPSTEPAHVAAVVSPTAALVTVEGSF